MTLHLSRVLEECQPRIAIMTGICAGDAEQVKLGDLVVAECTFTSDSGKFTFDEQGRQVHLHDALTYQLDAAILQFLGLFDGWKPLVAALPCPSASPDSTLKDREARCHLKAMASGSAVRADHPFRDVRVPVRGTAAIDMEGAAFALATSRHHHTPWLVVKGVCDYADQQKNDRYHDYAARASATYALSFLQAYVTNERLPRRGGPSPASRTDLPHFWNIPHPRNPFFTGRETGAEKMEQQESTIEVFSGIQKSGRSQGFFGGQTILLVGLVLLVLVASAGFFYLQGINHPASSNADTIATVQARDATAFAATSTAQTHKPPLAAITPTNTPTTNTNIYPPPGATLVLNDPLADNSHGYKWTENTSSSGACSFTRGGYNVSSPITPQYHACAALNTNFSNFVYEVEMTIIAGNCGVIIFRSDITLKHYYFFRICQNGSYDLFIYAGSGYPAQTLVQCDASCSSPHIHAGLNQLNVVAVVANNNAIDLYVNHQFITRVIDNTYNQGQIGVAADNDTSPTTVVFSNSKVWTL